MKKSLFIISLLMIISCQDKEKQTFNLPENAAELIAGDSIKTWKLAKRFNNGHRMNMGDCFLSYRISYQRNSMMRDNNSDYFDCGKSLDASWKIVTNDNGSFIKLESEEIPELLNTDKNYKYFKITALSENELVLQFKHTQYSNNSTIIIDYLVPENINVENRDFHNK
ncbi:lipocalin family protein [Gillisia sp. JM1]|uniref:lipocalin family protein n=1 Tax=Gillisia sp. JM1 TaxID=1283286 RepID=UPI0018CBBDC0|nr:lipocalin family protein [Gillisia sp. JM1]